MHPLMKLFFGNWQPPTGNKRKAVNGRTLDEHETMFNQWELQVIRYIHGDVPRSPKQIIQDLAMNTSSVYRILDRLYDLGLVKVTKTVPQGARRRVKVFVLDKDAFEKLKNGNR